MFSNYQWLLIGVIIACSCLVIYGSSSTSIKEGLGPMGCCQTSASDNTAACYEYEYGKCIKLTERTIGCNRGVWEDGKQFMDNGCCCPDAQSCDCPGAAPPPPCPVDPHYKRCWNECTGNDINCHSRPTTDAMRAAGAPDSAETCDPGYKSACGTGPQYNITDSPPGCRLPCVKVQTPCSGPGEPCSADNDTCCGCCGTNDPPTCQPQARGTSGCADYKPPPSCATFLSHNDCPTGTSSKAANTACGANSTGDCYDVGKCGCKCYLTDGQTAGQPRCLPITSNTGKGRWPNTQAHDYNANMNCGTCLPRSTEADCNAAAGWCYWGVPSEDAIPGSCPGENCASSDCCAANPQCSSLGSCPPYSSMINPSLVCGGAVCDNTIGGECCAANPVCSPDVCDLNTQVFTGSGVKCVGQQCSKIECCKSRAQCSEGVTCNPDLYNKVDDYSSKYCKDVVCELSECCKADPTCHNYTCPQYYTDKASMSSIKCGAGQACGTEKCCDLNPTCSSYFTGPNGATKNGGCPAHEHLKKGSANIRCQGPKCTIKECCGADAKCSSFKCHENNLYHTYAHIANAAGIPCTKDHCTQKQCCVATPTYALPKVKTYPIYKTNMFHHGGGSTLNQ